MAKDRKQQRYEEPDTSEEDEAALDRAWRRIVAERQAAKASQDKENRETD